MDRFNKFTVTVNSLVRNIHKIKSGEMAKLGLKSTHVSCLYYLYKEGGAMTARELCDVCGEDKAAISRAVDMLGREGYLYCEGGAKRYKSPIILTEKGREVAEFIAGRVSCILEEASAQLSDGDREIMYSSLDCIEKNLKIMAAQYSEVTDD